MADALIMEDDGICRKGTPGESNGGGGLPSSDQMISIDQPGAKDLGRKIWTKMFGRSRNH